MHVNGGTCAWPSNDERTNERTNGRSTDERTDDRPTSRKKLTFNPKTVKKKLNGNDDSCTANALKITKKSFNSPFYIHLHTYTYTYILTHVLANQHTNSHIHIHAFPSTMTTIEFKQEEKNRINTVNTGKTHKTEDENKRNENQ